MCKFADNEGKEVVVDIGVEQFTGIVIGCDPDIGVTIVEKDNTNHYLLCSHGMQSPVNKRRIKMFLKYKEHFSIEELKKNVDENAEIIIDGINKGYIDCALFSLIDSDASAENCSFL